ncbi:MAG: iron-hydroxamate ABC transporter substrate-binding protein [Thermoactinomyces sp.]
MTAAFCLIFSACSNASGVDRTSEQKEKVITYLNQEYKVPEKVDKIVTASLESMEDAAILGVKPIGAVTYAGKLPQYLAKELEGAESIGEKMQPNYETLLDMKPDVILGSTKYPPDVAKQLNKVAPMIPVSHVSANWEENLRLLAGFAGKEDKADEIIAKYKEDAEKLKGIVQGELKDKKVVVARIRGGSIYLYPQDVYFNHSLYTDFGLTVPEEIKGVKTQEIISLEKFAEMNPDYVFLQYSERENAQNPKSLENLQSNPIWQSIQAAKDKNVFVNVVDPLAQGGTAWSKMAFLEAVKNHLSN